MTSFSIGFDRDTRRYISGETVYCQVHITVLEKFKARSLTLRFIGAAHTEWTTDHERKIDGHAIRETIVHTGDEEYFRSYQYFLGQEHGEALEVFPGTYHYEGSFTLPNDLPTTIEHERGNVWYSVTVNYDVPWGMDKSHTDPFFVTAYYNLNDFPFLADAVMEVEEKTFCCFCCKSDPMQLIINLPKSGFVPGESILITIEVDNHSNVTIESVEVKLREKLTFISRFPHSDEEYDSNTVYKHKFNTRVAANQNKILQTDFYLDPEYNWKLMNRCGIINCEYVIETEAEASGCHVNASCEKFITIGTEPFDMTIEGFEPIVPLAPMPIMSENYGMIDQQPLPTYNGTEAFGPSPLSPPGHSGIGWAVPVPGPSVVSAENINLLEKDHRKHYSTTLFLTLR